MTRPLALLPLLFASALALAAEPQAKPPSAPDTRAPADEGPPPAEDTTPPAEEAPLEDAPTHAESVEQKIRAMDEDLRTSITERVNSAEQTNPAPTTSGASTASTTPDQGSAAPASNAKSTARRSGGAKGTGSSGGRTNANAQGSVIGQVEEVLGGLAEQVAGKPGKKVVKDLKNGDYVEAVEDVVRGVTNGKKKKGKGKGKGKGK